MRPWLLVLAFAAALSSLSGCASREPSRLEVFAELQQAPGNITVTPGGRVIVSLHQFFNPSFAAAEVTPDGTLTPFPSPEWNDRDADPHASLDAVLGLASDTRGVVWLLDNGMRSQRLPKLVGWDTRRDALARIIHFPPPVSRPDSFFNDIAIDSDRRVGYIADLCMSSPAIVVVDLETGASRRVLEGHPSVAAEDVDLVIEGRPVRVATPNGIVDRPRVGLNPIALDEENAWLYFGPMSGSKMYRIPTEKLRDASLPPFALAQFVEPYADRPICDGIAMDNGGSIYISAVTENAIGRITPERTYEVMFSDAKLLSWPDAFAYGPDGYMYAVSNQLHRSAHLNGGEETAKPPFHVVRFRPVESGVVGR